ncbi:MAG: hypothetical protein M3282_05845 [Gemmatimonadota bacterium]|nr:hypothetical protein [Gemmatimonadota bacterium]
MFVLSVDERLGTRLVALGAGRAILDGATVRRVAVGGGAVDAFGSFAAGPSCVIGLLAAGRVTGVGRADAGSLIVAVRVAVGHGYLG